VSITINDLLQFVNGDGLQRNAGYCRQGLVEFSLRGIPRSRTSINLLDFDDKIGFDTTKS
jgi:hypothetical protein